jgi:hypothetical protein
VRKNGFYYQRRWYVLPVLKPRIAQNILLISSGFQNSPYSKATGGNRIDIGGKGSVPDQTT